MDFTVVRQFEVPCRVSEGFKGNFWGASRTLGASEGFRGGFRRYEWFQRLNGFDQCFRRDSEEFPGVSRRSRGFSGSRSSHGGFLKDFPAFRKISEVLKVIRWSLRKIYGSLREFSGEFQSVIMRFLTCSKNSGGLQYNLRPDLRLPHEFS